MKRSAQVRFGRSHCRFTAILLLALVVDSRLYAWDPEQAYYQLEGAAAQIDDGRRSLNVLTDRPDEVHNHLDINTQYSGTAEFFGHDGPRVFTDRGACGVLDSDTPCCNSTCTGLRYCSILNDKRIEDKYLPTLPEIHGTCLNLDDRASRLVDRYSIYSIFGDFHTNRPFKDTEECRQLVLDYTVGGLQKHE